MQRKLQRLHCEAQWRENYLVGMLKWEVGLLTRSKESRKKTSSVVVVPLSFSLTKTKKIYCSLMTKVHPIRLSNLEKHEKCTKEELLRKSVCDLLQTTTNDRKQKG